MIDIKVKEFLASQEKIKKYNEAINLLRDVGFENILAGLGGATSVDYSNQHAIQMAAFQHAEIIGWIKCIDYLFNFLDIHKQASMSKEDLDYGARRMVSSLGYTNSEIENAINELTRE